MSQNSTAQSKKTKVLFLAPYPRDYGPSQRFRLEVYFPHLDELGIDYDYQTFYTLANYQKLYKAGNFLSKAVIILTGFVKRAGLLFRLPAYDFLFIQREATPIGPPIFEWIATKVLRKKMIYDFDDAIWLPNYSEENSAFHRLKSYWKVKHLIKWSSKVVAGNVYLENYAKKYSNSTCIIPTVVDTNGYHNPTLHKVQASQKPTLVWTGTLTTNLHIEYLAPVFEKLNQSHDYNLLLISNKKPNLELHNVTYIPWSRDTEISDLLKGSIGLMPLIPNFDFAKGKCGFKAIQYMALGIQTIVTPIGVNAEIVDDEFTGYHAQTLDDWHKILDQLIMGNSLQKNMTATAREKIQAQFSADAMINRFAALFH